MNLGWLERKGELCMALDHACRGVHLIPDIQKRVDAAYRGGVRAILVTAATLKELELAGSMDIFLRVDGGARYYYPTDRDARIEYYKPAADHLAHRFRDSLIMEEWQLEGVLEKYKGRVALCSMYYWSVDDTIPADAQQFLTDKIKEISGWSAKYRIPHLIEILPHQMTIRGPKVDFRFESILEACGVVVDSFNPEAIKTVIPSSVEEARRLRDLIESSYPSLVICPLGGDVVEGNVKEWFKGTIAVARDAGYDHFLIGRNLLAASDIEARSKAILEIIRSKKDVEEVLASNPSSVGNLERHWYNEI